MIANHLFGVIANHLSKLELLHIDQLCLLYITIIEIFILLDCQSSSLVNSEANHSFLENIHIHIYNLQTVFFLSSLVISTELSCIYSVHSRLNLTSLHFLNCSLVVESFFKRAKLKDSLLYFYLSEFFKVINFKNE